MTNDELIARAEAALEGVTEGPWVVPDQTYRRNLTVETGGGLEAIMLECPGSGGAMSFTDEICTMSWKGGEHDANAQFIAASRDLVPALIAALKASEARGKELEAENHAMKDAVLASISERMVAAGMVSLEESVSPDCLTKFNVHSGMTDLGFYEVWLERTAKRYIAMQAAHQTGEHVLDDDMFEYILGKAGMAKSALENYRAALKGGAE